MKTLVLTDELAYKLHTLYEHFDEEKHYDATSGDIEDELNVLEQIVEAYHKQEKNG